jgi:hypothetical protein
LLAAAAASRALLARETKPNVDPSIDHSRLWRYIYSVCAIFAY